jgi:hypothetical protein
VEDRLLDQGADDRAQPAAVADHEPADVCQTFAIARARVGRSPSITPYRAMAKVVPRVS